MQPVSLDRTNLAMLRDKRYLVSWKADGTRYLMLLLGSKGAFLIGRDNMACKCGAPWPPVVRFTSPDDRSISIYTRDL